MFGDMRRAWSWTRTYGSVLLAAGVFLVGVLLRDGDGEVRGWVVFAGVGLVALNAALPVVSGRRADRARAEFKITLDDMLQPLVRELSELTSERSVVRRRELTRSFIVTAANAALGLTEANRPRVTVFPRQGDVFEHGVSRGRGDAPVSRFARGTVEGDAVWRSAEADELRFVRDVNAAAPDGWDRTRVRSYRTFITVPIRAGDDLVGLLTINAPKPGDLTSDDAGVMRVIASLIGVAIGANGGTWPVGAR